MKEAQFQLEQAFRDFDNRLKQTAEGFRMVFRSLPSIEPPKVLLKPKKPWEHLNKTAYRSKKD